MKIIMPEFVLPVLEARACDLLDTCDIVVINDEGEILGQVDGAEVVMVPWGVPAKTYEQILGIPTLNWAHTVSAGIDHALAALPDEQHVILTNARGIFDGPIAEMVITYMLMVVKRVPEFLAQQRSHTWHLLRLRELAGLTAGIIGLGNIGEEIARRCKAFDMNVIGVRRHPELGAVDVDSVLPPEGLPELLAQSHFVIVAVPITPETRGLIGASELRQMRSDAWLINIARGAIVEETALLRALQASWIAGAALDVFDEEPLPSTSPLWDMPNVLITPHNSWSTPYLKQREAKLFLENLERYLEGRPLINVIDPSRGY